MVPGGNGPDLEVVRSCDTYNIKTEHARGLFEKIDEAPDPYGHGGKVVTSHTLTPQTPENKKTKSPTPKPITVLQSGDSYVLFYGDNVNAFCRGNATEERDVDALLKERPDAGKEVLAVRLSAERFQEIIGSSLKENPSEAYTKLAEAFQEGKKPASDPNQKDSATPLSATDLHQAMGLKLFNTGLNPQSPDYRPEVLMRDTRGDVGGVNGQAQERAKELLGGLEKIEYER